MGFVGFELTKIVFLPSRKQTMQTILVLGAGLSSSSLIRYLLHNAPKYNWQVRITDQNIETVNHKINGNPHGVALSFNATSSAERLPEIEKADLVISMLPARFHVEVARDCISLKKNLITPSYVSPEMRALDAEAKAAGIIILNEIGVDPGIDHMSAMKIIDEIRAEGGTVTSFKSYCGGLISPESDDNPWNYKFTWNPRNVVLAGQGSAACYIEKGEYKYIPYHRLFSRLDQIDIPHYGSFEGYANRDSLSYRRVYGLDEIPTIFRGTLRKAGFATSWNVFVLLGMTDDSYTLANAEGMTARNFLNAFLPYESGVSVEDKLMRFLGNDPEIFDKISWLGFFDNSEIIGFKDATPAQLLEKILVRKWALKPGDKDMLVMYHEFFYELNGEKRKISSSMVNIGEDQVYTSMSNTVGLPVAIAAKMILTGALSLKGVQIPVLAEMYTPILDELSTFGITFIEKKDR
ncbi:MAG: saccharopine dehydrogenase [Crocinitomicaceae bacterium]|jgi:saccharopine dehydrogenase-like NADP-dependent oxidoreductase|nr:saccharopine dehydrogenase [Crocinitomicaceae bacterium]